MSELTRRELIARGAGAAFAASSLGTLAAGCTVSREIDRSGAAEPIVPKIDGDLLVFNWAQYMDPKLWKEFGEKHGINVNVANFDSMEAMIAKLRAGAEYDLIFPTGEYVVRLKEEGFLHPFDRELLRNSVGIDPYFDSPWYDPSGNHTVPYAMYTTGICWRGDVVSGMTGSWTDLSNPTADGRTFILDDFQEGIGQANMINGFELNTENPNDLDVSKETLFGQKDFLRGFSTSSSQNLSNGTAVLHHAWNGDIVYVRNIVDNPEDFHFETCAEGVPVGSDAMAIPVNANHPGSALMFIDWLLEPEHAAQNVRWNGYPQPVRRRPGAVHRDRQGRALDRHHDRDARERARSTASRPRREDSSGRRPGRRSRHKAKAPSFWTRFLLPGGLWLALLFAVPSLLVIALSFGEVDDFGRAVYTWNPDNYADAFNPLYVPILIRSILYAAATAILCLAIGYPVAYFIARHGGRYKHLLLAALVIPFFVNYLVRTYAWTALLADEGLVNNALIDIGLTDEAIRFLNTPYAVIGGLVYGYLVFMILPVYASLERMSPSVIEAGKDLYGTPLQTFLHVTLPQTWQGILAGSVLVFLPAVGDFVAAQLLGGPDTYMIGNLIQDQFFAASNWPLGSAITVVMMLFLSVLLFFYLRSSARSATEATP